ncbi:Transcription factor SRM1-like protein [Drosera capensis]
MIGVNFNGNGGGGGWWTRAEDKVFEEALVLYPENDPSRWARIAARIPGKTPVDVRDHYEALVYDIREIDDGRVEIPRYGDDGEDEEEDGEGEEEGGFGAARGTGRIEFGGGGRKERDGERKRGTPWTEEEHRVVGKEFSCGGDQLGCLDVLNLENDVGNLEGDDQSSWYRMEKCPFDFISSTHFEYWAFMVELRFLIGLEKYGKGDWRSISRKVVISRTPTQVASHAQKYFIRQSSAKKERKRTSIHDITTVGDNTPLPTVNQNRIHPPIEGVPHPPMPSGFQSRAHLGTLDQGGSF